MNQVLKTIERIERLNLSRNGNPAYRVYFTDGTDARTKSDAAVGYQIGNSGMRAGDRVAVTYTRGGKQIAYMHEMKS